jgi:hypothetical protein
MGGFWGCFLPFFDYFFHIYGKEKTPKPLENKEKPAVSITAGLGPSGGT